jgi:hypothetical protein
MGQKGARKMSNEKPYGHAGEWEKYRLHRMCDHCCVAKASFETADRDEYFEHIDDGCYVDCLCQSCYEKYVEPAATSTESLIEFKSQHRSNVKVKGPVPSAKDVYTPEKRPIDPAEVDETWVGATVECVVEPASLFTVGKTYHVVKVEKGRFIHMFDNTRKRECVKPEYFTLVKKADESSDKNECSCGRDNRLCGACYDEYVKPHTENTTPKTRTEYTHSALLEFPNGDRVIIPPPSESEGWEAKTLWDESEWPHRYIHEYWMEHANRGPFIGHKEGQLIYDEYLRRYTPENPRIVSLTKWTREVEEPSAFEDAKNAVREFNAKVIPEVRKCLVESTWPQRHPPGWVQYDKNETKEK